MCAFCVRSDLLESKKLVLDDVFSCRAQGTVTLARKLITKIAEVHELRAKYKVRTGAMAATDRVRSDLAAAREDADKRRLAKEAWHGYARTRQRLAAALRTRGYLDRRSTC